MYIWKTENLATDIKNNAVGQSEWKKYYLAGSLFMTVAMYLVALAPRENITATLVEAVVVVGILIFGVSVTYQSNKGDAGVDYVARMIALTFPIMIKLILASFILGVIAGFLGEILSLSEEVFTAASGPIIQAIFFWRINFYIKYINS
ncbi:MAG: hypothetical protein V4732_07755 [Pseudomonadota bacterium]